MDKMLSYNTASLSVDFTNRFLMVTCHGNVDFEEYKSVLTKAAEIAEVHEISDVIINRLELVELNAECRVWMKNYFLKELIRPLIPNLTKVATIESPTALGQVYAHTISRTVSLVFPNLTFRSFTTHSAAYQWINPDAAQPTVLPVMAGGAESFRPQKSSQNNNLETLTSPPTEQRQRHLIDSLYQLFFANR